MEQITIQKKKKKSKLEVYKEELERIAKRTELTARNVVEEARSRNSPLHEFFDWNNETAGEKFRLAQARFLINSIRVIITSPEGIEQEMAMYENVSIGQRGSGREYKPVYEIIDNEHLREQIVDKALNELIYWKDKHKTFSEFKSIIKEIDKTARRLNKNGKK
jgi:hypothetical protein